MNLTINGPCELNGAVTVSGAKNSATRVLAAALVSEGQVTLRNFPLKLEDVRAKLRYIKAMGAVLEQRVQKSELLITVPKISLERITDFDLPIRTTYLLAAGMLSRESHALVPYPGGCKIGSRGYDLHMMVWQRLGCTVEEKREYIEVTGKLIGGIIDFPISTVGGTENALICAAVAKGETLIRNAYVTPEVQDLISFLREMGACIELEGRSHIRIQGNDGLLGGASFSVMPDRIEALTWIILGAVTGGILKVQNVPFETMQVPLIHLREAGIDLFVNSNTVFVSADSIGSHGIQPFELATGTHPGVISDMQPFFAFLGLFANGRSLVYDFRYPERINYAFELEKFAHGAINAMHGKIILNGPVKLKAAHVMSTDLRGSMALIMAAICAKGKSRVDGIEMALRGYNDLQNKLAQLGVDGEWMN